MESPARKKNNSVSFSLDSSSEIDPTIVSLSTSVPDGKEESDKSESRKNKVTFLFCIVNIRLNVVNLQMLKRLSYPLSWMDTRSGEKEEEKTSQPHSADHHTSSVFSKVFSR